MRSSMPSDGLPVVNMPDWREHVRQALGPVGANAADAEEIVGEFDRHLEDRYRQSLAEGATEEGARARALEELTSVPALVAELPGETIAHDTAR